MAKPFRLLRNRMDTYDLTQLEAAERMGISVSTMTSRMTGRRPWDGREVAELCELLEISRGEIGQYFYPDVPEQYE